MATAAIGEAIFALLRRDAEEPDSEDVPKAGQKETSSAFALFILIMLLIVALFTSYMLQQKRIQAVHETVLSIFAGMVVGLVIRLTQSEFVKDAVSFDYQFFFNLLLPPIILASGYELHQANFFRNIGTILTFAFAGTFISAVVLGVLVWLWTRIIPLDDANISFVQAFSIGATLSATDPVTILAIFNAYKVDPKLYTVIFGESILNDAIAIVLFETAQKYVPSNLPDAKQESLTIISFFEAFGLFLFVFLGSMLIGVIIGIATTLGLKFTNVRRFPKTESCLVILIAYASYFFAAGISMSGIVALLFCGITLKHYAYYNMSRRTQLTTKFTFQIMAQLSENFIFIYLGITLFTESKLIFKPLFIIVTVLGICAARYAAVFPLSMLINWAIRVRSKSRGKEIAEELPYSYQVMLFWAGLRGAVGVALAAGLQGNPDTVNALQATVLVVVVLTVIIFGGTTASMLDIMGIKTGVVEELDSDDEFDIETVTNGTYYKRSGTAFGHTPTRSDFLPLNKVNGKDGRKPHRAENGYSSGSTNPSPPLRPGVPSKRQNSIPTQREHEINLLRRDSDPASDDDLYSDSDLPPAAPRRSPKRRASPPHQQAPSTYPTSGSANPPPLAPESQMTAGGAIRELFGTEDRAAWFKRFDDGIIKPTLLLDQSNKGSGV